MFLTYCIYTFFTICNPTEHRYTFISGVYHHCGPHIPTTKVSSYSLLHSISCLHLFLKAFIWDKLTHSIFCLHLFIIQFIWDSITHSISCLNIFLNAFIWHSIRPLPVCFNATMCKWLSISIMYTNCLIICQTEPIVMNPCVNTCRCANGYLSQLCTPTVW